MIFHQACIDCLVWSVVNYGASVWGNWSYPAIEAVHNMACRFYLGLCQHAPTAAARGDMCLMPPLCKQHVDMTRQYHRLINMSANRLNETFFYLGKHVIRYKTKGLARSRIFFLKS